MTPGAYAADRPQDRTRAIRADLRARDQDGARSSVT